jgi:hypothetical protein
VRLLKIAARIVETASRVRVAFAAARAGGVVRQPRMLSPNSKTMTAGACAPQPPDPINHQRLADVS